MKINVQSIKSYLTLNRKTIPTYAKVIEATKCKETGAKLITFEMYFPRPILAEQNTHRKKSRNTGSPCYSSFKNVTCFNESAIYSFVLGYEQSWYAIS